MKKIFFTILALSMIMSINAQSFKETFDSNSLEWTECTLKNKENIQMVIDKGVLTVHSEKNTDFFTGKVSYSHAESMCYAPLDVMKPFKIISHIRFENDDFPCGILFNMKDNGTFYAISFIESAKKVYFERFVDNELVGGLTQGMKFPKIRKGEWYEVVIENKGQQIEVSIQGIPVFSVRYMPLSYAGFGFFTRGEQELTIDDVEFIQ